jgi:hypothetical protein
MRLLAKLLLLCAAVLATTRTSTMQKELKEKETPASA